MGDLLVPCAAVYPVLSFAVLYLMVWLLYNGSDTKLLCLVPLTIERDPLEL